MIVNDILIEYTNSEEDECLLHTEKDGRCSHLDRMINTLRYYSKVEVVSSRADKQQFSEFVEETKLPVSSFGGDDVSLLRDYVHIMERHKDSEKDIELIQTRKDKQLLLLRLLAAQLLGALSKAISSRWRRRRAYTSCRYSDTSWT